MAIQQLKFTCDTCGNSIEAPEQGVVTWTEADLIGAGLARPHNFRIVHAPKHSTGKFCGKGNDGPLGVSKPLALASGNEAVAFWRARMLDALLGSDQIDDDAFKELDMLLCRLAIPNFEAARKHLFQATDEGYFDEMDEGRRMLQATLKEVVKIYGAAKADA